MTLQKMQSIAIRMRTADAKSRWRKTAKLVLSVVVNKLYALQVVFVLRLVLIRGTKPGVEVM